MRALLLFTVVFTVCPAACCAKAAAQGPAPAQVMDTLVVDAFWGAADECFHEGDYRGAMVLNLAATRIDPYFVQAYLDAAYLLWSSDQHEYAVAVYMRCALANPENEDVWEDLGDYYTVNRRDFPKAVQAFTEAVKRVHDGYQVEKKLAHAYEKAGRLQDALDLWAELNRLHPEDGAVRINYERVRSLVSTKT